MTTKLNTRKWQYTTVNYICTNCTNGIVKVLRGERNDEVKIEIKKCDNCKHQFYIKQLSTLNIIE